MNNTLISTISNHRPRLFNNPVILREIIDRLRKKSSFISFSIFLGIVSVLFFCQLPSIKSDYYRSGSSPDLFMLFNCIQGIIILVLVPLFSATCINIERERCSWDLLITTPISIPSILLAKFLSPIVLTIIMASSLIPIYGLFITLGGVSPGEIIFTFAIFLELAITAALIGLYCSIKWKSTIISIYFTYLLLVILYVIPPILILINSRPPGLLLEPFIFFSPLMVIMKFANGRIANNSIETALIYHGIMALVIALFIAKFCIKALINQTIHDKTTSKKRFKRFVPRFIPAFFKTGIYYFNRIFLSSRNLLVRKEILAHNGASGSRVAISIFILLGINLSILLLVIMSGERTPIETYLSICLFVGIFLIPFLIVPGGVNCFRSEFDKDAWSLLSTTKLTPLQILTGKYMASIKIFLHQSIAYFAIPLLFSVLYTMTSNSSFDFNIIEFSSLMICLFVAANFYLMISILVSLYVRETLTAYGISFFTVFATLILPVVTIISLGEMNIISRTFTDNSFAIVSSSAFSPYMFWILIIERNINLNHYLLFLPLIMEICSLLLLTFILKVFAITRLKKIMNL
jgi:ABC-type transport system involved in multi-copper enzyme maturation permease subunit